MSAFIRILYDVISMSKSFDTVLAEVLLENENISEMIVLENGNIEAGFAI